MIRIVLLKRKLFESSDGQYCVYACKAGKMDICVSIRGDQPKILKTVEYKLMGEFKSTSDRKTFVVSSWEKIKGRVTYARSADSRIPK